ncbi:hypothetical protein D7V94_00635 [Parablautia intestinalis]|uniref:Uncharacterized protein n=1 Tax=Parablautia intestinalis TaxID=2320100 RepID=A0A3A9B3M4_9FIRM|nr:hypothetical protein D7V94_00635 [Parablautia intestinalis]
MCKLCNCPVYPLMGKEYGFYNEKENKRKTQ